jgi:hypothetical protein
MYPWPNLGCVPALARRNSGKQQKISNRIADVWDWI